MSYYHVDLQSGKIDPLQKYTFQSEGGQKISPQELIANNPQIIMDIPELEVQSDDNYLVAKEYPTSRGPVDILIMNSNADIVLIETKLLRNPDAQRTVVAQVIDYAKALYEQDVSEVMDRLSKNPMVDRELLSELKKNDFWVASLEKSIRSGNFQVAILGDRIHPNVLGMVESVQSAPHLAFTISLIEIDPFLTGEGKLFLNPKMAARTVEVERSVIRIEIDHERKSHSIESEIPEKEGKGTRPILTRQQYLDIVTEGKFIEIIENFWEEWEKIGGDIRMGVAGFSAGFIIGGKRIAPFFTYYNRIPVLSERWRTSINIPDDLYLEYKENLKASQYVYDGYCIGNKVEVPFNEITVDDLNIMYNAALQLGKALLSHAI
jgi:hypothetical protein